MIAIHACKNTDTAAFISACFDAVKVADTHDEANTEMALLIARQALDKIVEGCKRRGEFATIADLEQQFINCVRSCKASFGKSLYPPRAKLTLVQPIEYEDI